MFGDYNKALVRRYIDEVWNERGEAAPFFAPHYRRHLTASSPALSALEQQQRIQDFRMAFPNLHFTIEDLFAENNRVVFRATMRVWHCGVLRGIAPSGKQVAVTELDIVHIEASVFVEQWGERDLFDLLGQLGFAESQLER